MEQKSFLNDSPWQVGDLVTVGHQSGKIMRFHPTMPKVQLEVWDAHTGEKTLPWFDVSELPEKSPSPTTEETPEDDTDEPTGLHNADTVDLLAIGNSEDEDTPDDDGSSIVAVGQIRAAWSDKDVPYCEVLKENADGSFDVEVRRKSDVFKQTMPAHRVRIKWWRLLSEEPVIEDDTSSPAPQENEETDSKDTVPTEDDGDEGQETEVFFEEGDAFVSETGTQWKIVRPTVKGKYLVRVFLAQGGTTEREKTWQEIAMFAERGERVIEGDEAPLKDVVKAVRDKMRETVGGESPALPDEDDAETDSKDTVPTDDDDDDVQEPVPMVRERRIEFCVIRDKDGFHMDEASALLNEIIADGYRLEHAEYASMYIPDSNKSYVETVVYWTFLRLREPLPKVAGAS